MAKEWQERLDEALLTIENVERDGVGRHVIERRLKDVPNTFRSGSAADAL